MQQKVIAVRDTASGMILKRYLASAPDARVTATEYAARLNRDDAGRYEVVDTEYDMNAWAKRR